MNNKLGQKQIISLIIAFFWILVITGAYYYYHKPIEPRFVLSLLKAFLNLLIGIGIVGLFGALGRKIFPLNDLPPLMRAAATTALGAGILGTLWMILGVAGFLNSWLAWLIFLSGLLFLFRELKNWTKDFSSVFANWRSAGKFEKIFGMVIAFLLLLQLFIALAPPLKWDALTYHLQLPRLYIEAGNSNLIPQNPFWGYPQISEMLFTFSILLSGSSTAAVVTCWGMGVIFFVGVIGLTNYQTKIIDKKPDETSPGWLAALALAVGLTIRSELGWAYTDLIAGLFGLVSIIAIFEWIDTHHKKYYFLACLCAGFAICAKLTAAVLAIGILLGILFLYNPRKDRIKLLIIGVMVILLPFIPWLIKNAVATGNPVFPYIFATKNFSFERISITKEGVQKFTIWQRLFLPFSMTFSGVDSAAEFSTDLGPLLLLLGLPGLIFYWKNIKSKWMILIILPAFFAIGILSLVFYDLFQPRIYFVVLPAVALLAGLGWNSLQFRTIGSVRLKRIFGIMVVFIGLLSLVQDIYLFSKNSPLPAILGIETNDVYLEKGLGVYYLAMEKLHSLPENSYFLFLWEPRGLYAPTKSQPDLWLDRWETDRVGFQTSKNIINEWRLHLFNYVLVYDKGEELHFSSTTDANDRLTYNEVISDLHFEGEIGGWYKLYSIPEDSPK